MNRVLIVLYTTRWKELLKGNNERDKIMKTGTYKGHNIEAKDENSYGENAKCMENREGE
tara:strand:- start:529 stop:705 length:177 start_codon:yes stop_codon:yes gene_type:complete